MYMSQASAHHDLSACVYFMPYFITGVPHIYGKLFHSIHFFSEEHGTGLILGLLYHPIRSSLAIWIEPYVNFVTIAKLIKRPRDRLFSYFHRVFCWLVHFTYFFTVFPSFKGYFTSLFTGYYTFYSR